MFTQPGGALGPNVSMGSVRSLVFVFTGAFCTAVLSVCLFAEILSSVIHLLQLQGDQG